MALQHYLNQVKTCIIHKNGDALSQLVTYQDYSHSQSLRILQEFREETVRDVVYKPWDDLIVCHLTVCRKIQEDAFDDAFKEQMGVTSAFTKIFQGLKDENWPLKVLFVVCRDLRLLGMASDKDARIKGSRAGSRPHESLEKAADLLMGIFRVCATDIRAAMERSKRKGMITVINQLFKIYFRINKLHLCKPLIRALENADMMSHFPLGQQVTYNYFLGMKSLFDSDYKKAEDLLTFSFLHCPSHSFKNKQLVLIFLIPVKMILGHMPKESALVKYQLTAFIPLIKAVKEGNLKAFDVALEQEKDFYWKFGIYLILEKLRVILYRNIFKKVCLILNSHQIPIESLKAALDFIQGDSINIDEVHCILANLIYENKIKGYISIQHQKLVVSKQNAFPPLASVST